jgi:hypothetical protein
MFLFNKNGEIKIQNLPPTPKLKKIVDSCEERLEYRKRNCRPTFRVFHVHYTTRFRYIPPFDMQTV